MSELVYGSRDGQLIHISNVPQGLECNCVCPNCKENLIAKKGKINEYHFAHESKKM